MKTVIQKMLKEAYEMEGLLLLAENRGDETPEYVFTAIREKLDRLHTLVGYKLSAIGGECGDEAIGVTGFELLDVAEKSYPYENIASPQGNNGAERELDDELSDLVSEVQPMEEAEQQEISQETPRTEPVSEAEPVSVSEPESEFEPEPESESEFEPVLEPIFAAEEDVSDAVVVNWDSSSELQEPLSTAIDNTSDLQPLQQSIRLDEKLQRACSKDLRAAFSLNDTFRFRRELFGNNAAEMSDAITLVETMKSWDEAEEYFYNDLGWNKDNEDVKDFMAIIKNHFLQ